MDNLESRELLGSWLNEHGLVGDGAEVGVLSGVYSECILSKWKGKRLFLVDPWEDQPKDVYREQHGFNFSLSYKLCKELAERDTRVRLLKMFSVDASKMFHDSSLDFCYIDANHAYENVKEDIESWWPKIVPGGVLGGHDFYDSTTPPYWNLVKSAVLEWCSNKGMMPSITLSCGSWWVRKNP